MIKYSRRETPRAKAAIEALKIAKESRGSYNTPEVNAALAELFRGKCYICENKEGVSSYQIEHLVPHRGNPELKYDWNNLFWSCAHCNNIKNAKYEPILDCTKVEADRKIAFRKEGYFGRDEKFEFLALEDSVEVENTVALLYEAYYGSTPQKRLEATNIRRALRRNLSDFKNLIREYDEAEEYDKEDFKYAIRREVEEGAPFAAFKRWLLWDNKEKYRNLIEFCNLADSPAS
ncbi:HNH endonuclease [Roseburia hominis]